MSIVSVMRAGRKKKKNRTQPTGEFEQAKKFSVSKQNKMNEAVRCSMQKEIIERVNFFLAELVNKKPIGGDKTNQKENKNLG